MAALSEALQRKIDALPDAPGVYLMKDARGEVIYVGKAKVLRHRVRSYFQQPEGRDLKTLTLVGRIADLDWIVVPTEADAFVLENNLVRRHRPHYNLRLKDDKSFPYLQVTTGDPFPRVFIVRRPRSDPQSTFFGPFTGAHALRQTLAAIDKHFPIRKCNDRKFAGRTQPCLYHQIGRCTAPCVGLIDAAEHRRRVDEVLMFLKKDTQPLIERLEARMWEKAEAERYEEAARIRDQIRSVRQLTRSDSVSVVREVDADAWGLAREGDGIAFSVLFVRAGRIEGHRHFHFRSGMEDDELLGSLLNQYYAAGGWVDEVLLPRPLADAEALAELAARERGRRIALGIPQRGVKAGWMRMAEANALQHLRRMHSREMDADEAVEALQRKLGLPRRPSRIECYDISNLMGTLAVGSRVVFREGAPDKGLYRKYRIRTVEGANDFAMLKEVLTRRFGPSGRGEDRPDLLVVDGGKGQLAQAVEVLGELGVRDVPAIGLAKARVVSDFSSESVERSPERAFLPGRKNPILLAPRSAATFLLERVRDESHRFALAYHRRLRKKRSFVSLLEDIPGIGAKRKRDLLRHFGSLTRIREADRAQLAASGLLTPALAERIYGFFHPEAVTSPPT